mgnify:CR=1 FL=1
MTVPDAVDPRVLDVTRLPVRNPWLAIEVRDEVDSTNAVLVADPQPWRVLVAERQSAGRGRLARSWVTTPGQALAVSAVVPPDGMPVGWVPLVAGLAVAEAITATSGVGAALKWPNDVLLPGDGDRKVAGVLCEWTPVVVVRRLRTEQQQLAVDAMPGADRGRRCLMQLIADEVVRDGCDAQDLELRSHRT